MNKIIQHIIVCPNCHCKMNFRKHKFICNKCSLILLYKNGIILSVNNLALNKISLNKWDKYYDNELRNNKYINKYEEYMETYFDDVYRQIDLESTLTDNVYLEIGCGEFFFGQTIANKCKCIIGVDMSINALKIAKKMLDKKNIDNYLLIQSDIHHMPIRSNSIDMIYGGGVIEHFPDTFSCLQELYRVLASNGVSLNSVPYLNLGSLTYRQVWGNIPNFPIIRQIAEFIHIKLLNARHMIFGYELSFTKNSLRNLHKIAGFKKINVSKFDVQVQFAFAPKFFRPYLLYLTNNFSWFWPMIKVVASK